MFLRALLALGLALAGLGFSSDLLHAERSRKGKTDNVRIEYAPPKNSAHQGIYEQLKSHAVLEQVRMLVSPFRLPAPLTLKTEGCDGVGNAWYHSRIVVVCYEYIADAIRHAPQQPVGEITREDTILGAMADVFLHEIAHALFEMLKVPVFGREEDAADQLAAYVMLELGAKETRGLIAGVAYLLAVDAIKTATRTTDFAGVHGLPIQRFYNLLCMAYGANPSVYQEFVDTGSLPKERAEGCADEYAQVRYAFETLIAPHMDRELEATVRAQLRRKKWKFWPRPWP